MATKPSPEISADELLKKLEELQKENEALKKQSSPDKKENLVMFSCKIPESLRAKLRTGAAKEGLSIQAYATKVMQRGLF